MMFGAVRLTTVYYNHWWRCRQQRDRRRCW